MIKNILRPSKWANAATLGKGEKFIERFREIVSDPINLLIKRVPDAGYVVSDKFIILHNGNIVHLSGKYSYYGDFSDILIINRGVHEPLEEYCFQCLLEQVKNKNNVTMLELGAYWGHYSMWMLKAVPSALCTLVEPDKKNMAIGQMNFNLNNFQGDFINEHVSAEKFTVDKWVLEKKCHLDLLHCDIQGYEYEMLLNAQESLKNKDISYLMISTHSEEIHNKIIEFMSKFEYRLEVSSDFNNHTTSNDGFLMYSSFVVKKIFDEFEAMGRVKILNSTPGKLIRYLTQTIKDGI